MTHYWPNAAFLGDGQLPCDAPTLNGIPGALLHGRYDVSSPLETAWWLSRSWTTGRLHVVLKDAGYGGGALPAAIADALARLAAE